MKISPTLFLKFALLPLLAVPPSLSAQTLSGQDLMARVEGQKITRRELTFFWLRVDPALPARLGALAAQQWLGNQGASAAYTLTSPQIYAALYGKDGKSAEASGPLSSLVINRLVALTAQKQHISVTPAQIAAKRKELFDALRKQLGTSPSDGEIMRQFRIPEDIFKQDLIFRVQTDGLLDRDLAKKNGHSLCKEDYVQIRWLFANVNGEAESEAAKDRLTRWIAQIRGGQPFAAAASEQNEDDTRAAGGLRPAAVRGTGNSTLERAIYTLKPGEISPPLRGKTGWYAFTLAKTGAELTEEERNAALVSAREALRPGFLTELRAKAKITSSIPLK